jgi:acetyl-CoA carboxylase carboxyltransferase component
MVVTALVRLNGCTVGVVANRSARPDENGEVEKMDKVLCPKGAEKAAKFIRFCDAFEIPVLTMVDVEGFAKKPQCEPLLARAVGQLTAAYAAADVPMVTLITGSAYGSAAVSMGSRVLGADLVFAWPDAKIGAMDAKTAVEIMYADEIDKADRKADFIREKTAEYEKLTGTAEAAAKRGYVDEIIEVAETRKRVIAAFEMLFMKSGDRPERKHGTI